MRNENGTLIDEDRVQIGNIPPFLGHKQLKQFLEKNLSDFEIKKLRQMREVAYVSFISAEEAKRAIEKINGMVFKKNALTARLAPTDSKKSVDKPNSTTEISNREELKNKTARSTVTPLAEIPYAEQLEKKKQISLGILQRLLKMMKETGTVVDGSTSDLVSEVLASPTTLRYRNKNEFTVGHDLEGNVCVGFVGGKFSENKHFVLPIDGCEVVSIQTRNIVEDFRNFVEGSDLKPFDEFARVGTWKMLTVREFSGDTMLIITIFPLGDEAKFTEVKRILAQRFMSLSNLAEKGYRITSLYISVMENASDTINYELIAGAPYIYESLLGCRFRVSPAAFFQTNSRAAEVLYTTIGTKCGFVVDPSITVYYNRSKEVNLLKDDDEPEAKLAKIQKTDIPSSDEKGVIFLDICCGTGTIGQCILANFPDRKIFCVGLEIVVSATEDAKRNAFENGLSEKCRYVAARAEDSFRNIKYLIPKEFSLENSEVIGVLDPPRAGLQTSVITGCRELSALKKLIYVSCDPTMAMKNISDLCRPSSNKFRGSPFKIDNIQPVDMFPQTMHVEWIITLSR